MRFLRSEWAVHGGIPFPRSALPGAGRKPRRSGHRRIEGQPVIVSPYLTVVTVHCGQRSVLRLYGELDITNKDYLRRSISSAMEKHHPQTLIVDLSALGFADCGSLAVLVWAHVRLAEQGHQLVITGAQPIVRRLLSLTCLDTYLHLGAVREDPDATAQA
jgi:anti-anti-sigma factor